MRYFQKAAGQANPCALEMLHFLLKLQGVFIHPGDVVCVVVVVCLF